MFSLENKSVIVTGGANGIGAVIVKEFLKENPKHVAILDLDEDSGKRLENNLVTKYSEEKVKFYKCDVTNDDQLIGIFHEVVKKFGAIDVVVNNADTVLETMDTYKKEIAINYTAVVTSTLKALQLMRVDQGGKGGTIINISSLCALMQRSPFLFVYASTKSAVLHFSNCIGNEKYFNHTNVRVLTMCLGYTDTDTLIKYNTFDDIIDEVLSTTIETLKNNKSQSAETVAQGIVQAYKEGKSGSTWVIDKDEISDVTDNIHQAYEIMFKY
ncbi:alcohol dehydrogenase-like [Melitaea cinxia]|uniref:alcohol dehydrogenase-like n=1 Tax=Melitaea cinxia TaxID=113334 RepID=UPI001E270ABF|nr:alcohol dehydrogenase-like [Melitaea cinxia]